LAKTSIFTKQLPFINISKIINEEVMICQFNHGGAAGTSRGITELFTEIQTKVGNYSHFGFTCSKSV